MTETTPSTVERFFLAVWTISTTTSAILGNLVVLIAIKRKSIKLDRISVVIIGNLAVADMGCGLYVMTNFINIVAGRYVLGEKICYISVFLCNFFFSASILSLCSLNVSKATCLAFPFLARLRSTRQGCFIAGFIWIAALPILGYVIMYHDDFYFSPEILRCTILLSKKESGASKTAAYILFLYILIPGFIILSCTIGLLIYTFRKAGKLKPGTLATNLCVSAVFLISLLPVGMKYILASQGISNGHFTRFSSYLSVLNFATNPIVYLFTIRSFGSFVRKSLSLQVF